MKPFLSFRNSDFTAITPHASFTNSNRPHFLRILILMMKFTFIIDIKLRNRYKFQHHLLNTIALTASIEK